VAGSAYAGNLTSAPTTFAHEIATSNNDLNFLGQVYTMGIGRNSGQNFIVRYTLSSGTFGSANPVLTYTAVAPSTGTVGIVLRSGGALSSTVEFDVNVLTAGGGTLASDQFTLSGAVRFAQGAALGSSITIVVDLRDVIGAIDTNNNIPVAAGSYSRTLAATAGSASFTAPTDNGTVVDVTTNPPLTAFVAANDDSALIAKASITLIPTATGVKNAANTADYSLAAGDVVTLTITGDFTGISQVAMDLNNDGTITASAFNTTNEQFTIAASNARATLAIAGNRLAGVPRAIWFSKFTNTALSSRTFAISAAIAPALQFPAFSGSQARTLDTANSNWYLWTTNGTTLIAPYITFSQGNGLKFRFTNSSNQDVTVRVDLVLDQGAFTYSTTALTNQAFVIPAGKSQQITLSDLPSAGTNEIGPIAALTSGTQPVRGKATFTAITNTNNITGIALIYSPVGVITIEHLAQAPAW